MSTTHHTLATIQIPRGLVWVDEHDWTPAETATEYSITDALQELLRQLTSAKSVAAR